ncbi:MAG TPA: hypothetical protein VIZ28_11710 [Chitinophagaceae bacterium]
MIKSLVILFCSMTLYACHEQRIVTTWKVPQPGWRQYDKIMVAGAFNDWDDSVRVQAEDLFVKAIEGLSYRAVPAYKEFGLKGPEDLDQAEIYFKLYKNGIDAVMVIALIDSTKLTFQKPGDMYVYPAGYYFNRIWNYKNIITSPGDDSTGNDKGRFWEIILFDLSTLEATCVMQTSSFTSNINGAVIEDLASQVIRKLHKEKVLTKGRYLKPF